MPLQLISYRGTLVACATTDRFLLADKLEQRSVGDPDRTFVIYMCLFAIDVLRGTIPPPYSEQRARTYARAALIPEEILEHEHLDYHHTGPALGVPAAELQGAHREAASRRSHGASSAARSSEGRCSAGWASRQRRELD